MNEFINIEYCYIWLGIVSSKNKEKMAKKETSVKKEAKTIQRNRKQRRRESNPVDLYVQATP